MTHSFDGYACARLNALGLALAVGLACLNLFVSTTEALAADVDLVTPKAGAHLLLRSPETHVVLRQSRLQEKATAVLMKSNKVIRPIVSMDDGERTFLHFRVPLEPGKNTLTIMPDGQVFDLVFERIQSDMSLKTIDDEISQFHTGEDLPEICQGCHDLDKETAIKSKGLSPQPSCVSCHRNILENNPWQHSTTVNQQCLKCHLKSLAPWEIGFPDRKSREICFDCHTGKREFFSRKVVHGVIKIGGCTICHNPHGDKYRYQLWEEGSLTLCLGCHGDKQNLVSTKDRMPFVHNIIFGQGCTVCHDPHATNNQFMLIKPVNELCLSCHQRAAKFSSGHPVPRHPVSGKKELLRAGRKLTCVSCHNPHGSFEPYLLIETTRGTRLCHVCHNK